MARRALEALVRVLVQAGQWILVPSGSWLLLVVLRVLLLDMVEEPLIVDADADVDGLESGLEKLSVMRIFRDKGCVEVGEEPGQRGKSFAVGVGLLVVVEGVRAGTQKEGSVVFEDYVERVLDELMVVERRGDVLSPHRWLFELWLSRPWRFVGSVLHPIQIFAWCLGLLCPVHRSLWKSCYYSSSAFHA